ncbi:MAG: hypothetical protein V1720_00480 [bacterium]
MFSSEIELSKEQLAQLKNDLLEKSKELSLKEKTFQEKAAQIAEYTGIAKVLGKEKSNFEESISRLKTQKDELGESIIELKNKENQNRIIMAQIKSDSEIMELRKSELEKDFKDLLEKLNRNYNDADQRNKSILVELKENEKKLDGLLARIEDGKIELNGIRNESANVSLQKEDYTAKISQLIALEKTLQNKIVKYQSKIEKYENFK